jgi:RNA polymerase sigma-70 factor (ECF subfamily)
MIEELPHYKDRGLPFAAWLFRVARNAVIDAHRTAHPQLPLEVLAERPAETGDPEMLAEVMADREAVRRAIDCLPAPQREVVQCRFFADLTPCETAAVLGRSEGSVRVIQHRAIAALRQHLLEPSLELTPTKAARR